MAFTIFMAGDSTAAQKGTDKKPEAGWGEGFRSLLSPAIKLDNWAVNGRSTKSFIAQGRLEAIMRKLQPGDYLFIQFGHNDQKIEDPERYTDPDQAYQANLQRFITAVREKGGKPVLLTSVSRRRFLEDGSLDPLAVGPYPAAMRQVAAETNTPLLDMFAASQELLQQFGAEAAKELFLHLQPGDHPNYPDGVTDDTHFSEAGAEQIAILVKREILNNPSLAELHPFLTASHIKEV